MTDPLSRAIIVIAAIVLLVLLFVVPRLWGKYARKRDARREYRMRVQRKGEAYIWFLRWAPRPRRLTYKPEADRKQ